MCPTDKKQRVVLSCHHVLMLTLAESANLADPLRSGGSGGGQMLCIGKNGCGELRTVIEREWITGTSAVKIQETEVA